MRKQTDRISDALIIRQAGQVRELGPGHFIVRSQGKIGRTYSVGLRGQQFWCGCKDAELRQSICKHELSSIFFPALCLITQLRWATEYEDIAIIVELYAAAMSTLPEQIKAIAREEVRQARERLSGMRLAQAA